MAKKGFYSWHNYENHRAANFLGSIVFLAGMGSVVGGISELRVKLIIGGLFLFVGGCMGIPRVRWWVTRGRLSNVSIWDRLIGRTLFMVFSGIGALVIAA